LNSKRLKFGPNLRMIRGYDMQTQVKGTAADFCRRAGIVREIAEGIYDKTDRRFLLKFVSDSEKLAAPTGRKTSAR
jgi:hypothetical protein